MTPLLVPGGSCPIRTVLREFARRSAQHGRLRCAHFCSASYGVAAACAGCAAHGNHPRAPTCAVDTEQLAQHLTRGLKPLYAIHGEETLLALEAADRIRQRCHQEGYSEREVLTVESGFDWSRLAMSGNSLSLFSSKRLLELRIPSGKPGNEGAEALRAYAVNLAPDTVTLIALPKLDRSQLSSAWFTALDSAGVAVAASPVTIARLPQWLAARLALQEQQADQETLEFLVGCVEGNLLAAHQEVQSSRCCSHPASSIPHRSGTQCST